MIKYLSTSSAPLLGVCVMLAPVGGSSIDASVASIAWAMASEGFEVSWEDETGRWREGSAWITDALQTKHSQHKL